MAAVHPAAYPRCRRKPPSCSKWHHKASPPSCPRTSLPASRLAGYGASRCGSSIPTPFSVLPKLDVFQSVFPSGVVSLSAWMQREQPEFGGRQPRDEMALRGGAPVIALAETLTAAAL